MIHPNSGAASPAIQDERASRVLVVDDDEMLRRIVARSLRRAGNLVVDAASGADAIARIKEAPFDVIVSDVSMPDMDGIQLLREVRETDLDIPVVLMTGVPDIETANRAMEYGAFQFIPKPVDLSRLDDLLAKAVQMHRMARMKRASLELTGQAATQAGDRAGLEASLRRAFATLWIAYQPILRARDGSLYGYEALLRAREPSLPHPGAILDAAEKLGRVQDLGRLVRAAATTPIAADPTRGLLFVNLHARDLEDESLFDEDSPLTAIADRVVLEVTERASLDQIKDLRGISARLRALGYRIAIDDLGAGYAGLTSFALLEPEIVKLDMSLVRDVHKTTTKQRLVRSMAKLCEEMGLLVVAEGVETREERDALIDLGCDLLQGYLFAKPGPAFPVHAW